MSQHSNGEEAMEVASPAPATSGSTSDPQHLNPYLEDRSPPLIIRARRSVAVLGRRSYMPSQSGAASHPQPQVTAASTAASTSGHTEPPRDTDKRSRKRRSNSPSPPPKRAQPEVGSRSPPATIGSGVEERFVSTVQIPSFRTAQIASRPYIVRSKGRKDAANKRASGGETEPPASQEIVEFVSRWMGAAVSATAAAALSADMTRPCRSEMAHQRGPIKGAPSTRPTIPPPPPPVFSAPPATQRTSLPPPPPPKFPPPPPPGTPPPAARTDTETNLDPGVTSSPFQTPPMYRSLNLGLPWKSTEISSAPARPFSAAISRQAPGFQFSLPANLSMVSLEEFDSETIRSQSVEESIPTGDSINLRRLETPVSSSQEHVTEEESDFLRQSISKDGGAVTDEPPSDTINDPSGSFFSDEFFIPVSHQNFPETPIGVMTGFRFKIDDSSELKNINIYLIKEEQDLPVRELEFEVTSGGNIKVFYILYQAGYYWIHFNVNGRVLPSMRVRGLENPNFADSLVQSTHMLCKRVAAYSKKNLKLSEKVKAARSTVPLFETALSRLKQALLSDQNSSDDESRDHGGSFNDDQGGWPRRRDPPYNGGYGAGDQQHSSPTSEERQARHVITSNMLKDALADLSNILRRGESHQQPKTAASVPEDSLRDHSDAIDRNIADATHSPPVSPEQTADQENDQEMAETDDAAEIQQQQQLLQQQQQQQQQSSVPIPSSSNQQASGLSSGQSAQPVQAQPAVAAGVQVQGAGAPVVKRRRRRQWPPIPGRPPGRPLTPVGQLSTTRETRTVYRLRNTIKRKYSDY